MENDYFKKDADTSMEWMLRQIENESHPNRKEKV